MTVMNRRYLSVVFQNETENGEAKIDFSHFPRKFAYCVSWGNFSEFQEAFTSDLCIKMTEDDALHLD